MLSLNIKTLAGIMCAFPPCHRDGFKKYASLFREVILLKCSLCTCFVLQVSAYLARMQYFLKRGFPARDNFF